MSCYFRNVIVFALIGMVLSCTHPDISRKADIGSKTMRPNSYETSTEYEADLVGAQEDITLVVDNATSEFRVTVGYNSFLSRARETADSSDNSPLGKSRKKLYEYLEKIPITDNQARVNVEEIQRQQRTVSIWHFLYLLAEVLQKGKCQVVERSTGEQIMNLRVDVWWNVDGPTSPGGFGGRLFQTLDGRDVLKTLDWMT